MGIVVHIVDAALAVDAKAFESRSSKKDGDVVIKLGGMCNGVEQALVSTIARTRDHSIDALVFYGHGVSGAQGVSVGKDGESVGKGGVITVKELGRPEIAAKLKQLQSKFTNRGVVVLKGCRTAKGKNGEELIKSLSKATGVAVKSSAWKQIMGKTELGGNILTANPDGKVKDDTYSGMVNLGGYPPGEQILLLGAEFGSRILDIFMGTEKESSGEVVPEE